MSNRTKYLAAGGAAGLLLVVFAVWFLIFRDTAPPAASLDDAISAVTSTTSDGGSAAASLDGFWTIDTTIEEGIVDGGSYVGYRIQEEFANVGAKTAVGRTTAISGTFEFSGTILSAASVTADLSALQSDSSRRDGQMQTQALETNAFPEASFTLTSPVELGSPPAADESFTAEASGDLTIHGVTRGVTVSIEGRLLGEIVVIIGRVDILLADYDIDEPQANLVLSVDDTAEMELQLFLTRS